MYLEISLPYGTMSDLWENMMPQIWDTLFFWIAMSKVFIIQGMRD